MMTESGSAAVPLIPVRMVNEWVYCPRLAYLEWVDGEWADTGDTEDGRRTHARVDVASGRLPPVGEDPRRRWAAVPHPVGHDVFASASASSPRWT